MKVLLENLLRNDDGRLVTADQVEALAGGDPRKINPLIPAELVIDHSVIADVFARSDAFSINADLEFQRNEERYRLLRRARAGMAERSRRQ